MNAKQRILLYALTLMALTTFAFAFTGDVFYTYPGDWDCASHDPLTYGECWTGTPIPDGSTVYIKNYTSEARLCSLYFNAYDFLCGDPYTGGYFAQEYACTQEEGTVVYCEVEYQGCKYKTGPHTVTQGLNDIVLYEGDWTCSCDTTVEYCDTVSAIEQGTETLDISENSTECFISECTVCITALGGNANDVTVEVFDATPQFHPVGFNYMSRIVGIFWDGSADPNTSLRVRMHYTSSELSASGFSGSSCIIAARFNEFAASWAPIIPDSIGGNYVKFTTDRSGYYTFDCHGMEPRRVQISTDDEAIASGNGELILRWQSVNEFENYRFHILRADRSEGPFEEIATVNSQLPNIMATGSYSYEYHDSGLENGHTYYYQLTSEDLHGNIAGNPITVSGVPSFNGDKVQIEAYNLYPAYPNPFNPETRITYDVLDAGHVDLRVFDILGREVARLVNSVQPQGRYNVIFNAKDLPTGLYFYRINIGDAFTSTQKVLLLK